MAEAGLFSRFFLNNGIENEKDEAVQAPAFSLTKVLATGTTVLTALVAVLVPTLSTIRFTAGQVTTLVVAVIAFLAVASAADVIARAIATAAKHRATAEIVPFKTPLLGSVPQEDNKVEQVRVAAATAREPMKFLVVGDDDLPRWEPTETVYFSPTVPARPNGSTAANAAAKRAVSTAFTVKVRRP